MKKMALCLMFLAPVAFAQLGAYSEPESTRTAPPPSNIDLLKKSLKTSNVAAPSSAMPAATSNSSKKPALKPVSQTPLPAPSVIVEEKPASAPASVQTTQPLPQAPKAQSNPALKQKETPKKKASSKTPLEADIEANNILAEEEKVGGSKKEAKKEEKQPAISVVKEAEKDQDRIAQEELDYAARILQQTRQDSTTGRFIPKPVSKTAQAAPATEKRPYNPNDYRPGVEWVVSNSTHFIIYTQKRDGGIGSTNMSMTFENAYATLRRNIPWMMGDKVRVFVYQDHNSYLKYEPNAVAWSGALAYPTRGEIVVYDSPDQRQKLQASFTHELVHIFTQKYFDKHKTNRLMTPMWLDEGLAVYMEDQSYNGLKGGPWGNDFKTLNFQRSKESQVASFGSSSMFGSGAKKFKSTKKRQGPAVVFMPFDQFMEDGSLNVLEGKGKAQDWYFQAYSMVRFLLNPAGSGSPSNRMQFEQFTRLLSQGEQVRDPSSGFPVRDKNGKPVYKPFSTEKALGKAYRYGSTASFEDAFWRWADTAR